MNHGIKEALLEIKVQFLTWTSTCTLFISFNGNFFSEGVCSQIAYYDDYFNLGFPRVISMNVCLPLYIEMALND